MTKEEDAFSKDLLLLMLQQDESFIDSSRHACNSYKENNENADAVKTIGFDSLAEYNELMFFRKVTPTINTLTNMSDIIRTYPKNEKIAAK